MNPDANCRRGVNTGLTSLHALRWQSASALALFDTQPVNHQPDLPNGAL